MASDDECVCGHWRSDHEPGVDQDTSCDVHGCRCYRFTGRPSQLDHTAGDRHETKRRYTAHGAARFVWGST